MEAYLVYSAFFQEQLECERRRPADCSTFWQIKTIHSNSLSNKKEDGYGWLVMCHIL